MKIETDIHKDVNVKSHQCTHCVKSFLRIGDFKRHVMSHTGEKPFKCNQCDKAFNQNSHLKSHLKIHTGERPYTCSECDKAFIGKSELIRHHRVHTGEKPYQCTECDNSFSMKQNLESHMDKHTGKTKERPYQCKQCDKAFESNRVLVAHQRTHTGEKPYKCTHCGKSFSQKCNLVSHEKIHTGEKPHKCKYCNKCFIGKNDLSRHTLIHTQDKAYKCTFCSLAFTQNGNLTRHLKTHTGEKPYACIQCKKSFITKNQLVLHNRVHTGETPYKCSHCNKSFKYKDSFNFHLRLHTGENLLKCTYCTKAFSKRSHLKRHINIHTVEKVNMRTDQEELNQYSNCENPHQETIDCTSNQQPESNGDNISDEISTGDHSTIPLFCDDSTKVLSWLQQNELLKSEMNCDSCWLLMNWSETAKSRDGFVWTCQTKGCMKYQHNECIKLGSFFNNSHTTLPDWFDIMYLWCENVKTKVASDMVDISHTQVIDCYASIRAVCGAYFIDNPIKLGGSGISIEIDVARFCDESNTDHTSGPIMVLGIIVSNSSPLNGYMEIVESCDAGTILPIILKVVEPGSIIYTKDAKEYREIQGFSEKDNIVKQSLNFLDEDSSENIGNIESYWSRHARYINVLNGYKQNNQNSYLQELMWRDHFHADSFKKLCQHISDQYQL